MTQLHELARLTDVIYSRERARMQKVLLQELELRQKLSEIDRQMSLVRSDQKIVSSMQHVGADVVWKTWAETTRSRLNMKLAQVLAQKACLVDQVRRAYGKALVAEQLLERQTRSAKSKFDKKTLNEVVENATNLLVYADGSNILTRDVDD